VATQQLIIDVVTKNTQRLDKIEKALNRTNRGLQSTGRFASTAGKLIAGAFAVNQLLKFANVVKEITSDFQTYHNQLRLITKGEEDRNRVFNELVQMAKQNRTEFGATVDLYTKLRVSTEQLGVSEERVANVTSKLSKALQLAGADGNTAASVIRQFGQAMASGEVRGDEFRSLVEGLGPALSIMARETGINVGQLRKMSQAGELNAMVMFEMLENSTTIDTEFNKMNATIAQSEIAFKNAFERAIHHVSETTGVTEKYHDILKGITVTLDRIAGARPFENATDEMLEAAVKTGQLDDVMFELHLRQKAITEGYTSMGDEAAAYNVSTDDTNIAIEEQKKKMKALNEEFEKNQKLLEKLQASNEKFVDRQRLRIELSEKEAAAEKERIKKAEEKAAKEQKVLDDLLAKNQSFIDEILQLNETESEGVIRIRNERLKKIQNLLDKEVIDEQKAIDLKVEVNKDYHKQVQKMEDERLKKSQQRHKNNIELIKQGKIQEIDIENMTAEQKKEIQREAGMSILAMMATMNEKAFKAYKAVKIAEAIIDGKAAIQAAFGQGMKVGGPIGAFLFAGVAAAYTASQINAIKSTNYQGREMGGPVQKGKPYIVGEAGQEAFIPNQNGTIIPNHELGGKNEVTINFNVEATDASSFDSMLVERRDTIVGVINEALNEQGRGALV
jgi:tape measure domain-containing protein